MNDSAPQRPRILTGDTPTGKLHLGHYVGSIENRLALQESHDCFFIVANVHALTTRAEEAPAVSGDVFEIVTDYLACGIDPDRSTIFLQSEVPAIAELTWYFAMLLGHGRLLRNPTLKDELTVKAAEANHSFGFLLYPVGQVADILAFRPDAVPVGEDQVPHIEMTREVARRFNVLYAGVDPQAGDAAHAEHGVFPVPEPMLGRVTRLLGIDGKQKMSKSLGNAIFLADDAKTVEKKCRKIFTGRVRAEEPGRIEGNPVFQMLEAFHEDAAELEDMKARYRAGTVGDGDCKQRLAEVLNARLEPIRARRREIAADPDRVRHVLAEGTRRATAAAEKTLIEAKQAMGYDFFDRTLTLAPRHGG